MKNGKREAEDFFVGEWLDIDNKETTIETKDMKDKPEEIVLPINNMEDLRRELLQTLHDVRTGKCTPEKAKATLAGINVVINTLKMEIMYGSALAEGKINPIPFMGETQSLEPAVSPKGTIVVGRGKTFDPPTVEEFVQYFIQHGHPAELAKTVHESYRVNGWKDSNNKQIVNWKQKCLQVWFSGGNKSSIVRIDKQNAVNQNDFYNTGS